MSEEDIREMAYRYGFTVETDNDGQLVLYTNVYIDEEDSIEEDDEYYIDEDGELTVFSQ